MSKYSLQEILEMRERNPQVEHMSYGEAIEVQAKVDQQHRFVMEQVGSHVGVS